MATHECEVRDSSAGLCASRFPLDWFQTGSARQKQKKKDNKTDTCTPQ